MLHPRKAWQGSPREFLESLNSVANMFNENFTTYADQATPEVLAAAPKVVEL